MVIPEELLEQIERGNVLLFIGERVARTDTGQVFYDYLTDRLAARCRPDGAEILSWPEVAQVYADDQGRQALVQFVRDELEVSGDAPQPVHHLIAGLTQCSILVTTCLDQRLEHAFEEARRPFNIIIGNLDVAFEDERKAQLYKLRGSIERPDSLVLTEEDYETFFDDRASISVILQGYLARKTILFIGYDLTDTHFKRLYRKVTTSLDHYARRAYAFGEGLPPIIARWCKRHGINIVEVEIASFLEALTQQLAVRARLAPVVPAVTEVAPGDGAWLEFPYKSLDYYDTTDAPIFYGRQQAKQALCSLIHAHRLVLLYGASGSGKTSLLLAGVVPQLESADPPYSTIYIRALMDPARAIRQAVQRRLPGVDLPQTDSLVDFLSEATRVLGHELVIMLDQFEEFFIRLSQQFRTAFIDELEQMIDATDIPVKIVLSLREDWLAAIGELEDRIPEVFQNRFRLLPLTRLQAYQAITMPVAHLNIQYEPVLVEQILQDLMDNEGVAVLPPQLQLVCSALYRAFESGEQTMRLDLYTRLGGTRGVLQKYLDDELLRLKPEERLLARRVLVELVTSELTKDVKTAGELALAVATGEERRIAPVLEKLLQARLLRILEREDGALAYELAHEYLIQQINLDLGAQRRKQTEELIRQEVDNWQRFKTLLAADKLALIDEVRDQLLLNPKAEEFLFRSALTANSETAAYWLNRMSDEVKRIEVINDYLVDDRVSIRLRTVQALIAWKVPLTGELLTRVALTDRAAEVRQQAAACLAQWISPAIAINTLMTAQGNAVERVYEAVAFILDEMEVRSNLSTQARWQVNRVLFVRRLKEARQRLFYRTLAGGVGGAAGLALSMGLFAYAAWPDLAEQFGNIPRANGVLIIAILGGLLGLAQGIGVMLGLTFTETVAKERRAYWRLLGALIGGGLGMAVILVLLATTSRMMGGDRPYGEVFISSLLIGGLTGSGIALAIPGPTKRHRVLQQVLLGALAAGLGAGVGAFLDRTLVSAGSNPNFVSMYSLLGSIFGVGVALSLSVLDWLNSHHILVKEDSIHEAE